MPIDEIRPFNDPRVQLRSAHLNGRTYGYIFSPASTISSRRGTIVLVHGFPDISFGWRYQIPFLTGLGLDVIAIDCMGYGRTDAPANLLADYSFRRVADDIESLCRQNGISRIILGGHDWGGGVIYRVALYKPHLVTHIFSICTPFFPPSPTYEPLPIVVAERLHNFGYQVHFATGEVEEAVQSPEDIRQFLANMFGARTAERVKAFSAEKGLLLDIQPRVTKSILLSDEEMDYYVQEYSRHGVNGPLNWYRTREVNFMDEYAYFFNNGKNKDVNVIIQQECLFVMATRDTALRPYMSEGMDKHIARLTRTEIVANHWTLWEQPEQCNAHIEKWLVEKVFPDYPLEKDSKL
jgi:pimeloyl-ACP methyl ester carboxylesterase